MFFQSGKTVNIHNILPRSNFYGFRKPPAADTGNRIFTGRINVCQNQFVTVGKAFAEFFVQQLRPGVPVGLEYAYDPFCTCFFRCLQRCHDLGRMVRIIVHNPDSVFLAFCFKTAFGSGEYCQCSHADLRRDSHQGGSCKSPQRIQHIMPARHDQMYRNQFRSPVIQIIVGTLHTVPNILCVKITILCQTVGNKRSFRFFRQAAYLFVIQTQNSCPAIFHVGKVFFKCLVNILFRPVMVQMIVFNVGNNRNKRGKL